MERRLTWTYSGDPAANDRDAVRWLSGDTDTADRLVTDEEIAFALAEHPTQALAAAVVCEAIAAKFAREADRRVGDVSLSASQKAKAYRERAEELRANATILAVPSFGGLTISGKEALDEDTDAVQPSFRIGKDDHPEIPSEREYNPDDYWRWGG